MEMTCGWHNRQVSPAISAIATIHHPPFTDTTVKIVGAVVVVVVVVAVAVERVVVVIVSTIP